MKNNSIGLPLISGKVTKPQRVVIYGPEGIGKTTLAAAFPEPVFLDTEGGTIHLNVTRFAKPESWEEVLALVTQLSQCNHTFKTLVVDTVDWLEKSLIAHVCRKSHKDSIEDFGYGKGYTYLAEEFSRFLQTLEGLRDAGMHIVMVAHSTIKKFEQPDQSGSYDRYELKLSKQCAPMIKEWCDMLLFVNYYTKVTEKDGKRRATGGKERRIYTSHCAAFDAKNRHDLEDVLPMAFDSLSHVIADPTGLTKKNSREPNAIQPGSAGIRQVDYIEELCYKLNLDGDAKLKAFLWAGGDCLDGDPWSWEELTPEQAVKVTLFLEKKLKDQK